MIKFAITVTAGDNEKVIKTFDKKEEAMKFGEDYAANLPRMKGIVSCIKADFDENNNILHNRYELYEAW